MTDLGASSNLTGPEAERQGAWQQRVHEAGHWQGDIQQSPMQQVLDPDQEQPQQWQHPIVDQPLGSSPADLGMAAMQAGTSSASQADLGGQEQPSTAAASPSMPQMDGAASQPGTRWQPSREDIIEAPITRRQYAATPGPLSQEAAADWANIRPPLDAPIPPPTAPVSSPRLQAAAPALGPSQAAAPLSQQPGGTSEPAAWADEAPRSWQAQRESEAPEPFATAAAGSQAGLPTDRAGSQYSPAEQQQQQQQYSGAWQDQASREEASAPNRSQEEQARGGPLPDQRAMSPALGQYEELGEAGELVRQGVGLLRQAQAARQEGADLGETEACLQQALAKLQEGVALADSHPVTLVSLSQCCESSGTDVSVVLMALLLMSQRCSMLGGGVLLWLNAPHGPGMTACLCLRRLVQVARTCFTCKRAACTASVAAGSSGQAGEATCATWR